MAVDLEALDGALNNTTLTLLGDTITYTPFGGTASTFKALVDYGDTVRDLGFSSVVASDCAAEISIASIAQPDARDTVQLPRTGRDYQPKEWRRDESGLNWLVQLGKKPA